MRKSTLAVCQGMCTALFFFFLNGVVGRHHLYSLVSALEAGEGGDLGAQMSRRELGQQG